MAAIFKRGDEELEKFHFDSDNSVPDRLELVVLSELAEYSGVGSFSNRRQVPIGS